MKSKITLVIFIFFSSKFSWSQVAYYDAMTLSSYLNTTKANFNTDSVTLKKVASILKNYDSSIPSNVNWATLNSKFTSNKFLSNYIPLNGDLSTTTFSPVSSIFSSVGGLDVTNIADGIAQFMIERTKDELGETFFTSLNNLLNDNKYKDERTLFPNTYSTLSQISSQVYNYSKYLNSLRTAFEKDLGSLLTNLPKVIKAPEHQAFFNAQPQLKAICLSSLYLGNEFLNKVQPGQMIADYDTTLLSFLPHDDRNVTSIIKTIQLISSSLRSKGHFNYWVSSDSLRLLVNNNDNYVTFKIYLGLLCQQSHIVFKIGKDSLSFRAILYRGYDSLNKIYTYFSNVIKQVGVIQNDITSMAGVNRANLTFTDYYNFYNSTLDLIDSAANIYRLPGLAALHNPNVSQYINFAKEGGSIAFDISSKNYSSAIMNSITLLESAFNNNKDSANQSFLLKYGTFIATVAEAQNASDVKNALTAAVLPSGSSSIKQYSKFSVMIDSYIGILYAISGPNSLSNGQWVHTLGATAPIGISLNWPTGCKDVGAISAFFSIVDIGAFVAFRLNDDSTQTLPKTTLANILAPGIHIVWGRIANSPLSFSFGYQMTPQLRTITATNAEVNQVNQWQAEAALTWNIPFFNLHSVPKS